MSRERLGRVGGVRVALAVALAGASAAAGAIAAEGVPPAPTVLVSAASDGGQSTGPTGITYFTEQTSISADGTLVAFSFEATNIVPGDTNEQPDIFVKNLATGAITRASTRASGRQSEGDSFSPSLSADGSKVAFDSEAADLVPGDTNGQLDVFVKEVATGAIVRASVTKSGGQGKGIDSNSRGPWV